MNFFVLKNHYIGRRKNAISCLYFEKIGREAIFIKKRPIF